MNEGHEYVLMTHGELTAPSRCVSCGLACFGMCAPHQLTLCRGCFEQHEQAPQVDTSVVERTQVLAGFYATLLSLWQQMHPVPAGHVFMPDAIVAAAVVTLFVEHPRFLARAALADAKVLPLLYASPTGHNLRAIVRTLVEQAEAQELFPADTPPVPGYFDLLDGVRHWFEHREIDYAGDILTVQSEELKLEVQVGHATPHEAAAGGVPGEHDRVLSPEAPGDAAQSGDGH